MHEQSNTNLSFYWIDYAVFAMSLAVSLGIGFFFCMFGKRQSNNEQYLMGGRNINPVSMGLSVTASVLNAVLLIGGPAEVHYRGAIFSLISLSFLPATCIIAHVFVPKYRQLKTTSAYEYLGIRFNSMAVRLTGSIIFSGTIVIYLAVVLYAPALAFSQVTGLSIHMMQCLCGLVCTVYVYAGGMKAVAWTDTLQMAIIMLGTITIATVGAGKVGGFSEVWKIAKQDNRINFYNLSFDPTTRHTTWTQIIGSIFIWLPVFGGNQMIIQRYQAVTSTKHAQIGMYIQLLSQWVVGPMVMMCGLVMYASFRDCDPYMVTGHRRVHRPDQLFPLFIMEVMGSYHGLPGLYMAVVFSAALSSISSSINSLAAVTLEDFIKPIYTAMYEGKIMKEEKATWISKALTLLFGFLTIGLSYMAPLMGDALIQIPLSIWGVTGAPLFGMFVLAMFFPCANAVGTITGVITSLVFAFWLSIGGIFYGRRPPIIQPLGSQCHDNVSSLGYAIDFTPEVLTTTIAHVVNNTETQLSYSVLDDFYSISYSWYGLINLSVCVVVGLLVSCISDGLFGYRGKQKFVDPKLLYLCGSKCCCCLPKSIQNCCYCYIDQTKVPAIDVSECTALQTGHEMADKTADLF